MARPGGVTPSVGAARQVVAGLHKVALALRQETSRGASRAGLSAAQGQVLCILAGEPGLGSGAIAERLAVTPASASDTLTALVRKRLVTKTTHPLDSRAAQFRLTRRGDVLASRAADWPAFLAQSIDTLTAGEQQTLLVALTKMIRQLQQQDRISAVRMCVTCSCFRPNRHRGAAPHHCDFVDAPIGNSGLRLDCAEHTEARPEVSEATWLRWLRST